jgi:lysophospholipase L1-like esterase
MVRCRKTSTVCATLLVLTAFGFAGGVVLKSRYFPTPTAGPADQAVVPARPDATWVGEYRKLANAPVPANPDIVFLGDSQCRNWLDTGRSVWDENWAPRNAAVLAMCGDGTQHVLWRLEHGQFPDIKPKLLVLQVGTNNLSFGNSPEQIVDGIGKIVRTLKERHPQARVLVMGIFPRHPVPHRIRKRVQSVNAGVEAHSSDWGIKTLNIERELVGPEGELSLEVSADSLHLSEKGYRIWSRALLRYLGT